MYFDNMKPGPLRKYFLRGDALIEAIRQEFSLGPVGSGKQYKDYVRDSIARSAKSEALKKLARSTIIHSGSVRG
jgi:hypothetical protein